MMLEPFTYIGPYRVLTYMLHLSLAIIISGLLVVIRNHKRYHIAHIVDVLLGVLIGAVFVARLLHVGMNRVYFLENPDEAARLTLGGLDWHGALVGGLIGLYVMARWRRIMIADMLAAFAPGVALVGLAAWSGCFASRCAYGIEVATLADHPAFVVSEVGDIFGIVAPRYNTQLLGIILSSMTLIVAVVLLFVSRWRGAHFWLMMLLAGLSAFVVGFWRGDATFMIGALRADQWLDLAVALMSTMMVVRAVQWEMVHRTPTKRTK
ncbi:MAG: hypothetical protein CUN54_02945 [Phototrophicales bacterium]|nr:MAG: hypothetical protein CUN54_02945 [Phototrophicales bacterium]